MLINDEQKLRRLLDDLINIITQKKETLFELNRKITLDTNLWINEDFETVFKYLRQFIEFHYSSSLMIKPKGKILIILSYNEPFILSIIPILNALIVGNKVVVKPNRGSELFFQTVWTQKLLQKYDLHLDVSTKTHDEIEVEIKQFQSVYFFGSSRVAKKISEICGRNYVEFHPETETSDVKVFNKDEFFIEEDTHLTLKESFSHSGQTCQRIQGVYVHKNVFDDYVSGLKRSLETLDVSNFISERFLSDRKQLIEQFEADLEQCNTETIIRGEQQLPLIVVNPQELSRLPTRAYFLPVLWVLPFNSTDQLVRKLNAREFYLGINLQSDNQEFIKNVIEKTKFTRFTVNTSHTNVRSYEGWGGSWPSGFFGYQDWIQHFSNPYIVIRS